MIEGYPIGTLRCCNTLARPDDFDQCLSKIGRATICAQTRNTVCIVEQVMGFSESTCGKVIEIYPSVFFKTVFEAMVTFR